MLVRGVGALEGVPVAGGDADVVRRRLLGGLYTDLSLMGWVHWRSLARLRLVSLSLFCIT